MGKHVPIYFSSYFAESNGPPHTLPWLRVLSPLRLITSAVRLCGLHPSLFAIAAVASRVAEGTAGRAKLQGEITSSAVNLLFLLFLRREQTD